jgi:hypothetical protein
MKTVIIGTTAINRSQLHNDIIPAWYNNIIQLNKDKYRLHWFINIDYIETLQESVQDTAENFKRLIPNIPLTIVEKDRQDGNFLQACKRLSSNIEKYVIDQQLNPDDVIIMWLEDDWKLNDNTITLEHMIENYLSNLTHINLTMLVDNNYIHALAPSIMNYNLWSIIHLPAWTVQTAYKDPESCAGLYFIKHFCKYEDVQNFTIIDEDTDIDCITITTSRGVATKLEYAYYFQGANSYYTYNVQDCECRKTDKVVDREHMKEFNKDKITFCRMIPSHCIDDGRRFMLDNYNLTKQKNNICFYTPMKI